MSMLQNVGFGELRADWGEVQSVESVLAEQIDRSVSEADLDDYLSWRWDYSRVEEANLVPSDCPGTSVESVRSVARAQNDSERVTVCCRFLSLEKIRAKAICCAYWSSKNFLKEAHNLLR